MLHKLQSEIDESKIKRIQFDDKEFCLLYVGQAKKGHDRLVKYHILDASNFDQKGIENGFLSSLRTTLCGLLELPMSSSKKAINEFIEANGMVQREHGEVAALNELEKDRIQANYLPLNYQHTKGMMTTEHRKIWSQSKR